MLDHVSSPRRLLLISALALVVVAAVVLGIVLALRGSSSVTSLGQQPTPPPVVLVSGYGGDGRDVEPMVAALRDQGRTVAIFPAVADNTGDLSEQASLLDVFVTGELAKTGSEAVDVIGFSAGGVVVRLWVLDHGGQSVARRVLTIAAPHHGTELARLGSTLGLCPLACQQLDPDSDLLTRLNSGDETPDGTDWITMWSESDRTVTPPDTAKLDGSVAFTIQSVCADARTGHQQLPESPVVLAALSTVLGKGPPAAPAASEVVCG